MVAPVDLDYPFTGRWLVQNSPANRVPSHGTHLFATTYAIDFVPVDDSGRSARFGLRSLFRPEPPEAFVGFGRRILAPIDGLVVAVHDAEPDHPAYRGLPSLGYALTQRQRAAQGWVALAGNNVLIRADETDNTIVALCHLQQGSIAVRPGQRVSMGHHLAGCGNSGNSTEPHLHIQAVDNQDPARANAVPLTFRRALPYNGDVVDL
ncbi:M23 family metallopeptidase [Tessaracoccus caeni]|uniref:M23 family metallopeptidase n=1 Tax=Tessaracoccus caeni TaxID=3031239 RepID=UPI0023DBEF92|nr:M23 family metallopeptidase [Tessaracoccus caeni]MDF1489729.1 M23 family metallopeptidase [Tessaracoccus caeni]